jgi:hypothetical protein
LLVPLLLSNLSLTVAVAVALILIIMTINASLYATNKKHKHNVTHKYKKQTRGCADERRATRWWDMRREVEVEAGKGGARWGWEVAVAELAVAVAVAVAVAIQPLIPGPWTVDMGCGL